ncbi:MAG: hypothetical protein U0L76_04155 [Ruminococcus sp.]|nr:hypothetical protein [Ruminococcus sp.]
MLINIETNLSIEEIENILSNKICHKYPFFHREYDLGINWVSNNKNFICLFHEDGTKDRWGYQTKVKPFFYGKVIKVNNKYRIIGISCVNIFFIITALIVFGAIIFYMDSFNFDAVFGILFFSLTVVLFNLHIPKGNKRIKDYLERQFG